MQKQFKNILPIAVGSIAAGETMAIEVDASGLPVSSEYRKRVKDNGLIEIHRHIGGLENLLNWYALRTQIHRHIGGLEKGQWHAQTVVNIHRHIGGLEKVG